MWVGRVLVLVASEALVSRVPESVVLVVWVVRVLELVVSVALELVASACDLVVLPRWRKAQLFVRQPRWELKGWRSETVSQASIPD